jgi:carbonic anhydrase
MALIGPVAAEMHFEADPPSAEELGPLERASVVATLTNLMTFPYIRERVERAQLQLVGAYFYVGTGELTVYDPETGAFGAIASPAAS